jgi:hypothetical protein
MLAQRHVSVAGRSPVQDEKIRVHALPLKGEKIKYISLFQAPPF